MSSEKSRLRRKSEADLPNLQRLNRNRSRRPSYYELLCRQIDNGQIQQPDLPENWQCFLAGDNQRGGNSPEHYSSTNSDWVPPLTNSERGSRSVSPENNQSVEERSFQEEVFSDNNSDWIPSITNSEQESRSVSPESKGDEQSFSNDGKRSLDAEDDQKILRIEDREGDSLKIIHEVNVINKRLSDNSERLKELTGESGTAQNYWHFLSIETYVTGANREGQSTKLREYNINALKVLLDKVFSRDSSEGDQNVKEIMDGVNSSLRRIGQIVLNKEPEMMEIIKSISESIRQMSDILGHRADDHIRSMDRSRIQIRSHDDIQEIRVITDINERLTIFDEFTPNNRQEQRFIDFLNRAVDFVNQNDVPLDRELRYRQVRKDILDKLRKLLGLSLPDDDNNGGGPDDDRPDPDIAVYAPIRSIKLINPQQNDSQEIQVQSSIETNSPRRRV